MQNEKVAGRLSFVGVLLCAVVFGLPVAAVQADHTRQTFVEPFDIVVSAAEGCSGEDVHIFGTLELTIQTTSAGNGGLHVAFHLTPHLSGQGLSSGDEYNAVGPANTVDFIGPGGPRVSMGVNVINLISRGSTGNLVLHEEIHLTINANGVVTVDTHELKGGCRG